MAVFENVTRAFYVNQLSTQSQDSKIYLSSKVSRTLANARGSDQGLFNYVICFSS